MQHDQKIGAAFELTFDQLDEVSGGGNTANSIAYFAGLMIGEAIGVVKLLGSEIASLKK
ncbi:hypothetical protein [Bradyrhizobium sp. JYMT SZCCT0428]|uniref:hypothetical protein n=1 Tax=Bradyrhizobium sp. JYMT SZCCT0428 TaxID=2807673 RepID=UPI001BA44FE0|nr:hypothetical protein [Bradyrhizobium sp. JYMT SZCCT0428]MBR1153509.1 hypothetical protein [Bradyrhizobium sp. JYMT SZCCT0428]